MAAPATGGEVAIVKSLAQRVHDSNRAQSELESELLAAVQAACGELATGDDEEFTTDYYDNSIEVYGVGPIDLDAAALKLHGHGFARVWLHQHLAPRGNCTCRCRWFDAQRWRQQ